MPGWLTVVLSLLALSVILVICAIRLTTNRRWPWDRGDDL